MRMRSEAHCWASRRLFTARPVAAPGRLEEYEQVNVRGPLRLAHLAAEAGVKRIVYLSPIGVYRRPPRSRSLLDEHAPYEDRPADRRPYTQTKFAAEKSLLEFSRANEIPTIVILRRR